MATEPEDAESWPPPRMKAAAQDQAKALRAQAAEGGLRFEAYLPPGLAEWLLEMIAEGQFLDPSEAAFVIFGEHRELSPHADLRRELLRRRLQATMDDPRPGISIEEAFQKLREAIKQPRPAPAQWQKIADD